MQRHFLVSELALQIENRLDVIKMDLFDIEIRKFSALTKQGNLTSIDSGLLLNEVKHDSIYLM